MADNEEQEVVVDNEFAKDLAEAFANDEAEANKTPGAADDDKTPPANEEPKKDDDEDPNKKPDPKTPPADSAKKPEEGDAPAKTPETPPSEEEITPATPLTKDDLQAAIRDMQTQERTSGVALDNQTKEVMDAYYPDGLSNVLVDQKTGKQLRTPQDVVDASGGDMSVEEAAQWLINEQYALDTKIADIKKSAADIAETTLKFKQDSIDVLQRYDPLFKAYPTVQEKIWNQYSKLIKKDDAKGVILSAPDMREFYDTVLEPYRLAFEFSQKQSAIAPTGGAAAPGAAPVAPPKPAAPGQADRLDEGGDGGSSDDVDDPNDFAQQVSKELAKGI